MMQMEDDEIEAEAADEQEDSSGPRKRVFLLEMHTLSFISYRFQVIGTAQNGRSSVRSNLKTVIVVTVEIRQET